MSNETEKNSAEPQLFQKIPFAEAIKKIIEHEEKIKSLKSKGAILNGSTDLDREYALAINEGVKYSLQFNEEESLVILGFFVEKQENPNLTPEEFEK